MKKIAILIGNILEHYDNALFGLLAPFIATQFFDQSDPITALILTYGMLPLAFITKPLGALFFGWIGDRFGRRPALFYSLIGMAAATAAMGCLPTYQTIGYWAPLYLATARMLQGFFAAGESTGGAIYALELTPVSRRGFMSSLYDASTLFGILLASVCVTLMSHFAFSWRLLFFGGSTAAVWGLIIRLKGEESPEYLAASSSNFKSLLYQFKIPFLSILLASGFSHITYHLAFTLMNGYIPLISSISKTEVMQINTALLLLDLFLLPCFGAAAVRFGKEKVMLAGSLCATLFSVPCFACLSSATIRTVIAVRAFIILFGVAFAAPYHAWAMEQVAPQYRYRLIAFANAIASQLIGAPTSALCLLIYQKTNWPSAPGLYLFFYGLLASGVIFFNRRTHKIPRRI